jgi:hypothetical protein
MRRGEREERERERGVVERKRMGRVRLFDDLDM